METVMEQRLGLRNTNAHPMRGNSEFSQRRCGTMLGAIRKGLGNKLLAGSVLESFWVLTWKEGN